MEAAVTVVSVLLLLLSSLCHVHAETSATSDPEGPIPLSGVVSLAGDIVHGEGFGRIRFPKSREFDGEDGGDGEEEEVLQYGGDDDYVEYEVDVRENEIADEAEGLGWEVFLADRPERQLDQDIASAVPSLQVY